MAWIGSAIAATLSSTAIRCVAVDANDNVTPPAEITDSALQIAPDPQNSTPVNSSAESRAMNPYVVSEPIYKAYLAPFEKRRLEIYWKMMLNFEFGGSGYNLSRLSVLTPLRAPQRKNDTSFKTQIVEGNELRSSPSTSIDGALGSEPELSLSGRTESVSVRPSDEAAALRGVGSLGPSALVLLDGVPFNDLFNGWVPWADAPREGLARVELVPGGGATSWGNGALGGVIQLFTLPPIGELVTKPGIPIGGGPPDPSLTKTVVVGAGQVVAEFGSFDTRSLEFVETEPTSGGTVQLLGNVFATDGSPRVLAGQRGPIDVAAWSHHDWLEGRWRQLLGQNVILTATIRGHEDTYGDGTPYQQGRSGGTFASLAVASQPATRFVWSACAYLQNEGAASSFSFVNAARTAETPVIDQLDEPATAYGASWSGVWSQADGSSENAGFDYRLLHGEARDDFGYSNAAYTRQLFAGGDQGDFGAFLQRDRKLASTLRITFGARIDVWDETAGHQNIHSIRSGGLLSADRYSDNTGTEFSPSVGLLWRPTTNLTMHANWQQSFSRPTLSELYQPIGQDAVVTEANPTLRTEHNTSLEFGAQYQVRLKAADQGPSTNPSEKSPNQSEGTLVFEVTAFSNQLHDEIGILSMDRAPDGFPIFGSLPAGYIGQQRINLDRARIQGIYLSGAWHIGSSFSLSAAVLFDDPRIGGVSEAPEIAGKQIAGVSRHTASIGATWQATARLAFRSRLRLLGPKFQDDENTLRLADAIVEDFGATYVLTRQVELFLAVDNLSDADVDISRSAEGVIYKSAPRMFREGLRLSW